MSTQHAINEGPRVIACDESGAEGDNLMAARHEVFAHASVSLDLASAQGLMAEVRRRAPSQAPEFKAEQLLQAKHKATVTWLLEPGGPLFGHALVHLSEKRFFVVAKLVDLLMEEAAYEAGFDLYANDQARQVALLLHREGGRAYGVEQWTRFLEQFNSISRVATRKGTRVTMDQFFATLDDLRLRSKRRTVGRVMEILWTARVHATRITDDFVSLPALDPLFPALVSAIQSWGGEVGPVRVIHDAQAALQPGRVEKLREVLGNPPASMRKYMPLTFFHSLELTDSKNDARVQLADLMAGLCRKAASDELRQEGDPNATLLISPYIHPDSIWGDQASWRALARA